MAELLEPPAGSVVAAGGTVFLREEDDVHGAAWRKVGHLVTYGWADVLAAGDAQVIRSGFGDLPDDAIEAECEREDCQRIAATASDVYCEITGGLLSYPTYDARTVLAHANDEMQKIIDEECARVRAEAVAEREAIIEVIRRYLPDALPFNTLPEIVGGIARQRDFQHELKDHLAEVARRLTDERDAAVAEAVAGERRRSAPAESAAEQLLRDIFMDPGPVATPPATCTSWVSSNHDDEDVSRCGGPATGEWLSTAGEWQPICARHSEGVPASRLRSLPAGPVAIRLQPGRVGFGTDAFEVGGSLPGQPVATPTEPAIPARLMSLEVPDDAEADERGVDGLLATFDVPPGNAWPAGEYSILAPASPVPAEQPSAAEQALAARAEQALVLRVLDAHDDELGTQHGVAYRAMVVDHWRLIETFEPHRTGARAAFDRRAGEEEAELLGHRLAVGEAAEQPEER